ncbi:hypothetical protein HOLleu_27921 [Holothuria leucospilota]|uniref:Uncharacterized protein n=1 Tax=Holothuria leucospilota TaxID=206669 RepID=A0A9Q1BQL0_HOLLE|nr:hypothetical protein HOLleu_27921 [Holothuria leucospilota]
MDRLQFNYSLKNKPIPSKNNYLKALVEKVESVIKRTRWKAHFFLEDRDNDTSNEDITRMTYGPKSSRNPPQVNAMKPFEDDLVNMIVDIKFRRVTSKFQRSLQSDIKRTSRSDKVFVSADKTRNMYKMEAATYEKLLRDNITAKYRPAENDCLRKINSELYSVASRLGIDDRIKCMTTRQAFLTLKDHKESFNTNPSSRLINPAKSEMGKVSKVILDSINTSIRSQINANQWTNTLSVIEWFKRIPDKKHRTFIMFDIVDFYPSISPDLTHQSIIGPRQ